jgi:hypothetical protein
MEWIQSNWVQIVAGYLLFIKVITTIRDAIDTTPGNDVNWFEKACTIMEKLGASLLTGKRAK